MDKQTNEKQPMTAKLQKKVFWNENADQINTENSNEMKTEWRLYVTETFEMAK